MRWRARSLKANADLTLILTGSATTDRGDVGPAALVAAGGRLTRVGIPVDPGNLLFLGEAAGSRSSGLPGCARSPKLNGADWVLERLACGLPITAEDIAAMSVGGLLKEIPSRPEPRGGRSDRAAAPDGRRRAAGGGLGQADGRARQAAGAGRRRAAAADAGAPPRRQRRRRGGLRAPPRRSRSGAAALAGTRARIVPNPRAAEGMGTSIAAGIGALGPEVDAAVILLGDMPEITAGGRRSAGRRLRPGGGARDRPRGRGSADGDGRASGAVRPALFRGAAAGSRATGARARSLDEHPEFVVDVTLAGRAAETDLDTPEAWERWRSEQPA